MYHGSWLAAFPGSVWLAGLCVCHSFDARPPHFLSVVIKGVSAVRKFVFVCLSVYVCVFGTSVVILVILEKGDRNNTRKSN